DLQAASARRLAPFRWLPELVASLHGLLAGWTSVNTFWSKELSKILSPSFTVSGKRSGQGRVPCRYSRSCSTSLPRSALGHATSIDTSTISAIACCPRGRSLLYDLSARRGPG